MAVDHGSMSLRHQYPRPSPRMESPTVATAARQSSLSDGGRAGSPGADGKSASAESDPRPPARCGPQKASDSPPGDPAAPLLCLGDLSGGTILLREMKGHE